jgi:hypothetical protein
MPLYCSSLDCSQCKFTGECRRIASDVSREILGERAGRFDIVGIHDQYTGPITDGLEILRQRYHHDQADPSCPRSTLGARPGGSCRIKAGVLCFGACVCLPIPRADSGYCPIEYCGNYSTGA